MKKSYITPISETTEINFEGTILSMSIQGNVDGAVGTQHKKEKNPIWEKGNSPW